MIRRTTAAIILAFAAAISSGAQSTQTSPDNSANLGAQLKGKGLVAKLTTKNVNTKKAKAGDPIEVELTQDMKLGDQVVLPKGSVVKGTIAQVTQFSKGKSSGELDLVFDTVVPKGGQQSSTHLIIYALAAEVPAQPGDIYQSGGTKQLATSASVAGQVGAPGSGNELTPQTQGIFGFDSVELHPLARTSPPTSTITSATGNINIENGTKLVLVFVGQ
jgi:hypothetical protein